MILHGPLEGALMSEERRPHQLPDGTHVYPLSQVRRFYETESGGNGEMRWSLHDGLTFRLELPLKWAAMMTPPGKSVTPTRNSNKVPTQPHFTTVSYFPVAALLSVIMASISQMFSH